MTNHLLFAFARAASRTASLFALAYLLLTTDVACSGCVYSAHFFSFPPGTQPEDSGWVSLGRVIIEAGSFAVPGRKKITVLVHDRTERALLHDGASVVCTNPYAKAEWGTFDTLVVALYEVLEAHAIDTIRTHSIEVLDPKYVPIWMRKYVYIRDKMAFVIAGGTQGE